MNEGQSYNANDWPAYGLVGRETRKKGGFAIHAHGGYAQEIYADAVQGDVDAVELLQFGIYRGIELADWYAFLNAGFRFPCVGASDFPACRKLGDCVTYVEHDPTAEGPEDWLRRAVDGRSFVTTGRFCCSMSTAGSRAIGWHSRARDRTRHRSACGFSRRSRRSRRCKSWSTAVLSPSTPLRPTRRSGNGTRSSADMELTASSLDRRSGVRQGKDRCSRCRVAHQPRVSRHGRQGPL